MAGAILAQEPVGAYCRRLCGRMPSQSHYCHRPQTGPADILHAHQGQDYIDAVQQYYEDRYRERIVQNLLKRAQGFGFQLVPAEA